MTGQEPLDGRNESVDFSEGALKERFETAVAGVSPDVPALMEGGIQRGEQLKRRRRAELIGATGLSAAAAVAVIYSGVASNLFDSNSTGPADTGNNTVEQINRPATARSLAAAALRHLPADEVIAAGTMGTGGQSSLVASVGLSTSQGKVQLDLIATSRVKQWDKQPPCAPNNPGLKTVQCHVSTLVNGEKVMVIAEKFKAGQRPATYQVLVAARRQAELVGVLQVLRGGAAPKDDKQAIAAWNMPVSVATMREIVTDPRFGVLTSPQMIARGNALDHWTNESVRTSLGSGTSSGSSGSVTVSPPVSVAPPRPTGPQATQASAAERSAPAPSRRPSASGASSGP